LLAVLESGQGIWLGELILGLAGMGVYAVGRRGKGRADQLVTQIVRLLEEQSLELPGGITWETPPAAMTEWQVALAPNGYYNLGLAHGIGGVIGFLAQAVELGHGRALPLLQGAVAWLLSHERQTASGSWFPAWVLKDHEGDDLCHERLSWCYGTLGLSAALCGAGRRVGRKDWEARALGWARQCALAPVDNELTWDGCLCHGALGNAHIFNRFFQATGEPSFRQAALTWISRAMELRRPTPLAGGFLTNLSDGRGGNRDPWVAVPGLLEGATGSALALIAAATPIEPAWDAFLQLNIPPGG
jgi:hypothetical protein